VSETQNEYETEQETDVEPTPGPWELDEIAPSGLMKPIFVESGDATICAMAAFLEPNSHVDPKEALANARLIAAAGTAAQEAKEMGYAPVAAVEALPELLKALEDAKHFIRKQYDQVRAVPPTDSLAYVRVKDALASAEGSGDE
jgi:hypothetical protein